MPFGLSGTKQSGKGGAPWNGVAILARNHVPVLTCTSLPQLGRYMSAVGKYLRSGDTDALSKFKGKSIGGHVLITDPDALSVLAQAGALTLDDIIQVLRERTELLNVAELAALLRVAEDTIQGWARRQQIPSIKIGKIIRFDGAMLADWVELQGDCTHPIIRPFLHPRAPGNPDEYQMKWTDLGDLAPKEFRSSGKKQEDGAQ